MKIEPINIIPSIIKWAINNNKPFEQWENKRFFSYESIQFYDWNKIETDNILKISEYNSPFDGRYGSDEVHSYSVLLFMGKPVIIAYMFGDRSNYEHEVISKTVYKSMFKKLANYINNNFEDITNLDFKTSINISDSYLQMYIKYNNEKYVLIKDATWGGTANTDNYIMTIDDDNNVLSIKKIVKKTIIKNTKYNWKIAINITFEDGTSYKYEDNENNIFYVQRLNI